MSITFSWCFVLVSQTQFSPEKEENRIKLKQQPASFDTCVTDIPFPPKEDDTDKVEL